MTIISQKITSPQNPQIKLAVKLRESSKTRKLNDEIIFEGVREFKMSAQSQFIPRKIFISEESSSEIQKIVRDAQASKSTEIFYCSKEVFKKIALRDDPQNLVCIGQFAIKAVPDLAPKIDKPIFLVLDGLEKPGNIGAIFRTADALALDGIIILEGSSDILSPNSIRASLGTVFTVPWIYTDHIQLAQFFGQFSITPIAAYLDATSTKVHATNFNRPVAIFLGSEAHGLSSESLKITLHRTIIPMCGAADSLNVSVATALIAYEAIRQQGRF